MSKRVYISSDYSEDSGDRNVVELLNKWGSDKVHKVDFIDMAKVISGSISNDSDCRPCDLKKEFNDQINVSSAVIFVVGDKTASRTAGSECPRVRCILPLYGCTPYKQNNKGSQLCKYILKKEPIENDDVKSINTFSYLKHEFEQAKKREKNIIIIYNSSRNETHWLPSYMAGYESVAWPFWIKNTSGEKVGNYAYFKQVLGYD